MTIRLDRIAVYEDDRGNRIEFAGVIDKAVSVTFRGSGNIVALAESVRLGTVNIARCRQRSTGDRRRTRWQLGPRRRHPRRPGLVGADRLEGDVHVEGDHVGRRGHDHHDRRRRHVLDGQPGSCGRRPSDLRRAHRRAGQPLADITIGPHVWVGWNAAILAGSSIGAGSVVALGAVVRGQRLSQQLRRRRRAGPGGPQGHRVGAAAHVALPPVLQARREHCAQVAVLELARMTGRVRRGNGDVARGRRRWAVGRRVRRATGRMR